MRIMDEGEWEEYQLENQRVVCAACRWNGVVVLGARHLDPQMRSTMKMLFPDVDNIGIKFSKEQGFIDQWNNYLTRRQALEIATRKNQMFRRCGDDEIRLYSENLY